MAKRIHFPKQMYSLCLNLLPRSHIHPSYFWLVTELNTVLQIPFFSTGMELYQDIFMKCLNLHSVDIAQDHRWHWTYLCGKQIQGKKAYPSQGQKYGPKQAFIKNIRTSSFFMHAIKKVFYFICKTNSSYYHLLMIDILI